MWETIKISQEIPVQKGGGAGGGVSIKRKYFPRIKSHMGVSTVIPA